MDAQIQDNPHVIAPPPLIFLAALGLGLIVSLAFPVDFLTPISRFAPGLLLIVLAAVGLLSAFRTMQHAGTPLDPRETPRAIVSTGPYRFSRNPIYLSMALFVLGVGLLADALWVLVLLPVVLLVINYGVIAREERYLERKFGPTYLQYKSAVRRWI
jgi:protein-S-isoprenylcysteine O-methyltransferase Ste14